MTAPHDMPSAADLVEAVREFLERDVLTSTDGRVQFHTRVAINALNIVQRELEMGPAQADVHVAGLARLGMADEAALAAAIRDGRLDDRIDEVRAFLAETVAAKLAVANPRYAGSPSDV